LSIRLDGFVKHKDRPGIEPAVNIRKVLSKTLRHASGGTQVDGGVHAVVSANVGERGARTVVRSRQRVVQRSRAGNRPDDTSPDQ